MKNILKHLCSVFLLLLVVFVFVGCKKDDVVITINVNERIAVGEKANLNIEVNVKDYQLVSVKSSDNNILEYQDNSISGINVGNAAIIVTISYDKKEYQASKDIEVFENKEYKLEVEVNKSLFVGDSSDLVVKETTTNSVINDYSVFFDKENIVKVENGKLVALSEGEVNITFACSFNSGNITTVCKVVVAPKPLDVFKINLPERIYSGQLFEIEVTYLPTNQKLEEFMIESSNTDCFEYYEDDFEAQTYDDGTVILTITATVDGVKYSQDIEIVVLPALALEIDLPNEINTKEAINYKVYLNPGKIEVTNYSVSSTNISVFTIEVGKVTPVEVGKGIISLSCEYDGAMFSLSHQLSVVRYYPETLASNINEVMFINESLDTLVTLEPNGNSLNDYTITSSNQDVISVNNKTIKALKEGQSEVTITSNDLVKKYQINVVTFNGLSLEINNEISEKEVVEYKVIAKPSNLEIKNYTFESSNKEVLLVNNGLVFGNSFGSSELVVSYTYNNQVYKDSKNVLVNKVEYPIERLYISGANGILVGTSTTLNVSKYPSVGVGDLEFTSSDPSIASISGNVVSGLKEGRVVIDCKVVGSDVSAKFNIVVINKNELSEVTSQQNDVTARYYEDSITLYHELMGGVKHIRYNGFTSTQLNGDADGYSGIDEAIVLDKYYEQQVNILEVPSNKDIKVVPWANLNNHKWSLTTVRGLIEHFEAANPGLRVIAAINGDFFDINAKKNLPYSTTGENISDGEFYKTSNSFGAGGGTIGFTNDGSTTTLIGGSHAVFNQYMTLAVYNEDGSIMKEFKVTKFNSEPEANETSVYYGTYNSDKNYVAIDSLNENTFVVSNAELALPNDDSHFYGKGVIDTLGKVTLQIGQFAITTNNEEVKNALSVGKKIRVQFEIDENDKYAKVTSATGYNCAIYDDTHSIQYGDNNVLNRAPRTVIGQKEDGTLVMMVVDGRQGANKMYGCDGYEIAAIMRSYGCINAYNVDGGGSSTMVIRTDSGLLVTNSPSDGRERSDGNCIIICVADPNYNTSVSDVTATSAVVSVSSTFEEYNNKEVFVNIDNVMYPVISGKVELTNLLHNTDYNYRVYYKENDQYIATQSVGVIKTLQSNFRFLGFTITETETSYIINSYSDDIDKCGNISEMAVNINDYQVYLKNGTATVLKKNIGEKILSIYIEYWYIENGSRLSVKEDNPKYFVID